MFLFFVTLAALISCQLHVLSSCMIVSRVVEISEMSVVMAALVCRSALWKKQSLGDATLDYQVCGAEYWSRQGRRGRQTAWSLTSRDPGQGCVYVRQHRHPLSGETLVPRLGGAAHQRSSTDLPPQSLGRIENIVEQVLWGEGVGERL